MRNNFPLRLSSFESRIFLKMFYVYKMNVLSETDFNFERFEIYYFCQETFPEYSLLLPTNKKCFEFFFLSKVNIKLEKMI